MTTNDPLDPMIPAQPQPSKARKEQAPRSETANVHIEHYFPKGYDPDAEPWKSIKSHHYASLAAEREKREQATKLVDDYLVGQIKRINELTDKHKQELAASEQSGFKRGLTFYERNEKTGEILVRYHEERK